MPNKKQRIASWVILSGISILVSGSIEIVGEVYFTNSWFHTIASFVFASGAILGILGIVLAFASLAWADWQESKNTSEFVALGRDDCVIAIHRMEDAIVHLPIIGTSHQLLLTPKNKNLPLLARDTLEHIHTASQLPVKVEVMDDDLYKKLFGTDK